MAETSEAFISDIFPISHIAAYNVGQYIPKEGIFLGSIQASRKIWGIFVSPQDLDGDGNKKDFTFKEAAAEVSSLRYWYGYDGYEIDYTAYHSPAKTLIGTITSDPRYKEQWFIGPLDFLRKPAFAQACPQVSMFEAKDVIAFKNTFTTSETGAGSTCYVSSTISPSWSHCQTDLFADLHEIYPTYAHHVNFATGKSGLSASDSALRMKVRPVRLKVLSF